MGSSGPPQRSGSKASATPSTLGPRSVAEGRRAIFRVSVGVGVPTLAALSTPPDTLPPERREAQTAGSRVAGYGPLLRHRRILAFVRGRGIFLRRDGRLHCGATLRRHHGPPGRAEGRWHDLRGRQPRDQGGQRPERSHSDVPLQVDAATADPVFEPKARAVETMRPARKLRSARTGRC